MYIRGIFEEIYLYRKQIIAKVVKRSLGKSRCQETRFKVNIYLLT